MNPAELLAAYSQLAKKHDLPRMEPAKPSIVLRATFSPGPTVHGSPDSDGWEWLRSVSPQEGWLQFQSHVAVFTDGELPEPAEDWGLLLAAEAVLPDGRSLLLRPDGQGGLRAVVVAPDADARDEAPFAEFEDVVSHRATDRAGVSKTLRYTRYWRADPDRGVVPVLAAFQGFGREEN